MDDQKEWLRGFTTAALLMQYDMIEKALDEDDHAQSVAKKYEVRKYVGWRRWATDIEAELDQRKVTFGKIKWE